MTDFAHPSLDDLADLHEGLLPADRSQELREHIVGCESCTAAMDALDDVEELLATTGASAAPMPSAVAQSLDEALSRVSLERAEGVTSLDERRTASQASREAAGRAASARSGRWVRMMGAAAAVVVVGYGAVTLLQNVDSSDESVSDAGVAGRGAAPTQVGEAGAGATQRFAGGMSTALTPKNVAKFARQASSFPPTSSDMIAPGARTCRAPRSIPAKATVTSIRWDRAPAVAVVDPEHHVVTIYSCGPGRSQLYSTSY